MKMWSHFPTHVHPLIVSMLLSILSFPFESYSSFSLLQLCHLSMQRRGGPCLLSCRLSLSLCLSLLSFFFKPNECGLWAFNEIYGELTPQSTRTHSMSRYRRLPVQANTPTAVHIPDMSRCISTLLWPSPLYCWSSHNALCPFISAAPPCSRERRCSSPRMCVCEAESCPRASWLQTLQYFSGENRPASGCLEATARASQRSAPINHFTGRQQHPSFLLKRNGCS